MLELLIAYYCAPVLAGIKPSNIASCCKEYYPDLKTELKKLNGELNRKDIYIDVLCECESRVLVIVYRKGVLEKHLQQQGSRAFLGQFGYPGNGSFSDYLDILKKRINCSDFPHEIGVFLGYPLHDIYCFINQRDEGCLMVGEWKVYHKCEEAEKIFCRFKACQKAFLRLVAERGKSLAQIFCAA